jgi:hypothetical protein
VALASGEYIVGLSGRYGNSIDLLTIITMQGNGQTNHYTFGQTGGQIDFSYTILADLTLAGFVGMAGQYLDAIGFLLEEGPPSATPPPALVQLGPSGGHPSSDTPFNYQPIPDGAQIIGFTIWPGNLINAIQLYYTGQSIPSASYTPQGGSNLSPKPVTITFSEDEYIESISGRYGESVDSINFTTNVKTYSFGGTGGDVVYNYEVPPGYDFVGIWGWAGKYIDAIGFVVRRSQ